MAVCASCTLPTGPYLQGLPEEVPGCEGNAFYALHSCLNHSCEPSVHAFKREQDVDGAGDLPFCWACCSVALRLGRIGVNLGTLSCQCA